MVGALRPSPLAPRPRSGSQYRSGPVRCEQTGLIFSPSLGGEATNKHKELLLMSDHNEDFLTIDPDLGRRPVLAAGDYDGILDRCDVRPNRFDKTGNTLADHFEVVVRHEEFGIVRLFADKDRVQGTVAVRWFRQLGVTDEEMRSGFSPSKLTGTPVIVTVGIRQYADKDTGEQVQQNTIKNLVARA